MTTNGEFGGVRRLVLDVAIHELLEHQLPRALAEQGFEILSRVALEQHLHPKLGVAVRSHTILGLCNPHLSAPTESSPESLGLLLQCVVVLYELEGRTVVAAVRPTAALEAVNVEGLREIAEALERRLDRVLDELGRRCRADTL